MATKRKKSYKDMSEAELNDANIALQDEKEAIREEQMEIKAEEARRATEARIADVVQHLSSEEKEAVTQAINGAGGIKSQERVGNKKR